jgi:hypothetical protein
MATTICAMHSRKLLFPRKEQTTIIKPTSHRQSARKKTATTVVKAKIAAIINLSFRSGVSFISYFSLLL